MEDWLGALTAASQRRFHEPDQPDCLSGYHHWYATSHARPTYCNVCREALSGVTSHGLSCEVCKCKVHKRCAAKAINNCKWTTLASVGKDIVEDADGVSAGLTYRQRGEGHHFSYLINSESTPGVWIQALIGSAIYLRRCSRSWECY
ncbi:C1 1 domain containing protein [Asbolus verrucosus]|uniref:C1 1 domain containing protein n=1 Tax=Asbolus verrucosus TaxID=1661398 RepID=A0A482VQT9_ASBVE|nr:C1 1 domain containing protein [Asbolus verrucosus]